MALGASAKQQDNNPDLSLQEFSDLLFHSNEQLADNLKALQAPSSANIENIDDFAKSITAAHW